MQAPRSCDSSRVVVFHTTLLALTTSFCLDAIVIVVVVVVVEACCTRKEGTARPTRRHRVENPSVNSTISASKIELPTTPMTPKRNKSTMNKFKPLHTYTQHIQWLHRCCNGMSDGSGIQRFGWHCGEPVLRDKDGSGPIQPYHAIYKIISNMYTEGSS